MTNTELWKSIENYKGFYEISNLGRVKSKYKGREIILKANINHGGYYYVVLYYRGKNKTFRVNRLVADAFIPNPNNYPQVNHKDENKLNNNLNNLEWCTSKYNCNYGSHNIKMAKSRCKPINQYDLEGNFIKTWNSGKELAEHGYNRGNINRCCYNLLPKADRHIWKFADKEILKYDEINQ